MTNYFELDKNGIKISYADYKFSENAIATEKNIVRLS